MVRDHSFRTDRLTDADAWQRPLQSSCGWSLIVTSCISTCAAVPVQPPGLDGSVWIGFGDVWNMQFTQFLHWSQFTRKQLEPVPAWVTSISTCQKGIMRIWHGTVFWCLPNSGMSGPADKLGKRPRVETS